jgi:3-oxoacyl-[acyl-carrier protein] reductase
MAQRFAAEGAAVLVADIDEASGQATLDTLDAARAAFRHVDVSNEEDCAAAVAEAVSRWGGLDVMVANAGIAIRGTVATMAKEDFERIIAVNLTGVFLCAKHAFRAMQAAGGGTILATASVAGLRGTPGLSAYGVSKAGVIQMVKTLALEGARYQIRANALCPIWTLTPMVEAFVAGSSGAPEEVWARLMSNIPLGRLGDPLDVANAAVYLASDEAAFITGVAFPVDGGAMA